MSDDYEDDELISIYDDEGRGIILEIALYQTGTAIRYYLTDEAAQRMINIMQNKINARYQL